MTYNTPPNRFNAPLAHRVCGLYKKIYLISSKIPKRDRFGIYSKIENLSIECIILTITAALEIQDNKLTLLKLNRIKMEVLKNLIRIIYELDIINYQKYIDLEFDLREISKMTNGWIKYLNTKKFQ